jgi:hypothetical protein
MIVDVTGPYQFFLINLHGLLLSWYSWITAHFIFNNNRWNQNNCLVSGESHMFTAGKYS